MDKKNVLMLGLIGSLIFGIAIGSGIGYVIGVQLTTDKLSNLLALADEKQRPFGVGEIAYTVTKINTEPINYSEINISELDIKPNGVITYGRP